ncbi:MAG: thermonuclease family protein [Ilumatobacteraceae bacterium]|nr:thermonuclease family protein [Ilumatobacteraceae bacterium]
MLRWRPRNGNAHRAHLTRPYSLFFFLAALATGCGGNDTLRNPPLATSANEGVVVSVADGDTFDLEIAGKRDTVRLIRVDTPETKHPTKGIQCWGPEASDFTKSLLAVGTRVRLVRDAESRDRYGRLLAYVYLADTNVFVNRELVRLGFARPYPFEPNTTHKTTFADAAWEAQGARRGLWGAC